jgi:hypothetical protein
VGSSKSSKSSCWTRDTFLVNLGNMRFMTQSRSCHVVPSIGSRMIPIHCIVWEKHSTVRVMHDWAEHDESTVSVSVICFLAFFSSAAVELTGICEPRWW